MKRVIGISLVFLLLHSRIFAQEFSSVQNSPANPNTHTTITYSMSDTIQAIANTIQRLTFNLAGEIIPIAGQPGNLNHSDMTPFNAWLNGANQFFVADSLTRGNQAMVPYTTEVRQSAKYCARLVIDSPLLGPKPVSFYFLTKDSTQLSDAMEDRPDLYKNAQLNGALFGLYTIPPNGEGRIILDKSEKIISNVYVEDCGDDGLSGEAIGESITGISKTASFPEGSSHTISIPFGNIVAAIAEKINIKARLDVTKKARVSNDFLGALHSLGAIPKHLTDEFITANRGSMDGWPGTFLAESLKKPGVTTAKASNELALGGNVGNPKGYDDPNLHLKGANDYLIDTACIVQPNGLDGNLSIGNAEKNIALNCAPKVTGQCPIDIIEQGSIPLGPSCGLKNANNYTSLSFLNILVNNNKFTFEDALPNGVPPLMQKVLEAAGSAYNVPASILLGTMLEEGAFNHADTWTWTDETVKKYSDCTNPKPMAECTNAGFASSENAMPPFGFIQGYWDNLFSDTTNPYIGRLFQITDENLKTAVENIPEGNMSPCNFTDAAFAAARVISEDHSHYQKAYVPVAPLSCSIQGATYNTNITSIPSSCSDWDNNRVALARMQYSDRQCNLGVWRMITTFGDF